ncbi:Basic helix-loop-helix transcription factor [Parasponia andersonii]|uniref:Basic helix-loop-helix transcription factor n=1 Tax=Parasponia andersonii TaxID=3476 RepID=A0A2P5BID1_PARAD|nr:Basic helix-loop-helix transcription factor [Parasponia andersonii]
MNVASSENTNWLYDYGLMEDVGVPGGEFPVTGTGFIWPLQPLNASPDASVCSHGDSDSLKEVGSMKRVEVDCSSGDSDNVKEVGSRKRQRSESSGASCSKACREKLRRDRLNDRFLELVAAMEPGRLPKTDKAAILSDAVRILTQLRSESRLLKETIDDLQERIKELKAEKNELRDERQRLKEDKDRLEQQVRAAMTSQTSFLPHSPAIPTAALAAQGQLARNKLMPFSSYPSGVTMWQLMPHTTLDTSQDHVLRPHVA